MLRGAILSLTAGIFALGMCRASFAQDHPAKDQNSTPPDHSHRSSGGRP